MIKQALIIAIAATMASQGARAADVTIVENGVTKTAIYATPDVMAEDRKLPPTAPFAESQAETQRRKLRESVKDLSLYLERMSGAKVEVLTSAPAANDKRLPILVGSLAVEKFGPVTQKAPYAQGFRVVVSQKGVGLFGESDEATSYAIYEVLDRLGCRWFLPSEMGEEIPRLKTVALPAMDFAGAPGTWFRGIWHSTEDYQRRNRMGGFGISAGHALETAYLTREQLEEHPDWNAMLGGKRSINGRFCWASSDLSDAVAASIIAKLDARYVPTLSLSPGDGSNFCECEKCKALDAGDFDAVMDTAAITDRFVHFCNRIATPVAKKYPDIKLGFLAYVQFTQAPVREKLHPNLVPMIAPINYCRAHAMTDACDSRQHARRILEGWAKASPNISYYNYMFNLAEYSAPYPMMRQMSEELPLIYKNNVKFWQPEGIPDYEAILPGHYLSLRMAWDPTLKPEAVLDEFFHRFYGSAEAPMRRYWQAFDDAWTKVDEHAGCGWGYWRRFTPEFMKGARATMDEALQAVKTVPEYRRVKMQDDALRQFERFMQLRWDLNEGRLAGLGPLSEKWMSSQLHLGEEYEAQRAFDKVGWTPWTASGHWFKYFFQKAYVDASRIAKEFTFTPSPLRKWKYAVDKEKTGDANGWHTAAFDDAGWKTTDVGVESWAFLGLENFYGPVWYRSTVKTPALVAGKKAFLWVSSADGDVKVFVNGQAVPYLNPKGEAQEEAKGTYCLPLSFDITAAIKPGVSNQISIRGTRVFINELGSGGLLGPVYLYREK
jgi:hypothetical protein